MKLHIDNEEVYLNREIPQPGTHVSFKVEDSLHHILDIEPKGQVTVISVLPEHKSRTSDMQIKEYIKISNDFEDVRFVFISNESITDIGEWCNRNEFRDLEYYSTSTINDFAFRYGFHVVNSFNLYRATLILNKKSNLEYIMIDEHNEKEPDYKELRSLIKKAKNSYA